MGRFHELLQRYESFHDRPGNRWLHWLGTPPILVAVIAALRAIPMPAGWPYPDVNAATAAVIASLLGFAALSRRVAIGMAVAMAALYAIAIQIDALPQPTRAWAIAALFAGGWVLQFWGHAIQGERPRFVGEPVFLLVGPSALICQVYDRLGIRY